MRNDFIKWPFVMVLTFFQCVANAQEPKFEWARSFGGITHDQGYSIAVDVWGNVYTTGYFTRTCDFDPGDGVFNLTSAAGSSDIFISKLDPLGNFVWANSFGNTNGDVGNSIAVDNIGNVYLTGYFSGEIDFDPGIGVFNLTGGNDIFVLKLDASGNFVWAKKMGGVSYDEGVSIDIDSFGNVYTAGNFDSNSDFESTVDFDPGPDTFNLQAKERDVFISKLDSNGNFVWARSFGGASYDMVFSIAVDASGNIYTTGFFYDTADFDPGPDTLNLICLRNQDIFISKLDANGNFLWAKGIGGNSIYSGGIGQSMKVDESMNVYITGWFTDTMDFDPGISVVNLTSGSEEDIFILKLDSSGNFLWVKQMGGVETDRGLSIDLDSSGNIYNTGYFQRTTDLNPDVEVFNLSSIGRDDIFISKLDIDGRFLWAFNMGGLLHDEGRSIAVDGKGGIYTTGSFQNTADFDPGLTSYYSTGNGGTDIFIHKMSQQTIDLQLNEHVSGIVFYPNPNSGLFNLEIANPTSQTGIEIYNSLGILVYKATLLKSTNSIDLSEQAIGLYFIKVVSDDRSVSARKIVKQ